MSALALLSGGLDSTVATALSAAAGVPVSLALFVDYGQRAARAEARAVLAVGRAMGLEVVRIELPFLSQLAERPGLARSALLAGGAALPRPAPGDLDGPAARASADAVWVPNRNGVLVNLGAALAEARGLRRVVVGFNREEAATFPDNGAPFVAALSVCLAQSTRGAVEIAAPCLHLSKAELVAAGRAVGAPIDLTWSCYEEGPRPCGTCESCRRRERAGAGSLPCG